jgi:cation transport ATPase
VSPGAVLTGMGPWVAVVSVAVWILVVVLNARELRRWASHA